MKKLKKTWKKVVKFLRGMWKHLRYCMFMKR